MSAVRETSSFISEIRRPIFSLDINLIRRDSESETRSMHDAITDLYRAGWIITDFAYEALAQLPASRLITEANEKHAPIRTYAVRISPRIRDADIMHDLIKDARSFGLRPFPVAAVPLLATTLIKYDGLLPRDRCRIATYPITTHDGAERLLLLQRGKNGPKWLRCPDFGLQNGENEDYIFASVDIVPELRQTA